MRGAWVLLVLAPPFAATAELPAFTDLSHDRLVPVMELLAQDVPQGIRPGAWMSAPLNCTMAFILQDTLSNLYITTAGHCVSAVGQAVSVRGHGEIGTVVTFEDKPPPWGAGDFALIRIHPHKHGEVNATMAGWGGPVGMVTAIPATNEDGRLYGWGVLTWFTEDTRCREIVFLAGQWTENYWRAEGAANSGDSGSPVMTADGRAVGIVQGSTLTSPVRIPGEWVGGYRLDYVISFLESETGLDLTLVDGVGPRVGCGS